MPLEALPTGLRETAVSAPPHERSGASLTTYALPWGLAIFPAIAGALFLWRLTGLTLLACGVLSAVLAEGLCALVRGRPWRVRNGHAALVGCLLALTLPTRAPGWLAAAGAAFGILFAQEAFGGNGYHLFHPALAGRLFLYLSWPQYFHRSPLPGEIPLALPEVWKGIGLAQLNGFLFQPGRLLGEASAALLVLGALFLMFQGTKWRIPLGALILVGLGTRLGDGMNPWLHGNLRETLSLPSLYLLLGFMAVEPVTTPLTHEGQWAFGLGLGGLVVLLRAWRGDPEGLFVLPLVLGMATPLFDRLGDRRR